MSQGPGPHQMSNDFHGVGASGLKKEKRVKWTTKGRLRKGFLKSLGC